MKIIYCSLIVMAMSCQSGNNEAKSEVTTAPAPATVAQEQTPQPYFKGGGSEPGWTVSVDANNNGSFSVTLNRQEGGPLSGQLNKVGLSTDGKPNVGSGEVKLSGQMSDGTNAELLIAAGSCTDAAGDAHTHSCRMMLGETNLKGCGDYSE